MPTFSMNARESIDIHLCNPHSNKKDKACLFFCLVKSTYTRFTETRSVTMNIIRKKKYFHFKSFVKIVLSYVITINMFSSAESCMEQ